MSRSNNTEVLTPVKKYFEWDGVNGCVKAYNKETKQNESFSLPFTFLILDMLNTITGFHEPENSGFWASEVRSPEEVITVFTKSGTYESEIYKNLKCLSKGAKFAKSIYIAYKDEDNTLQIGNLKLSGSGLTGWFEFTKKVQVYKIACQIAGAEEAKKGTVSFKSPLWKAIEINPETDLNAKLLDEELQEYFRARSIKTQQDFEVDSPKVETFESDTIKDTEKKDTEPVTSFNPTQPIPQKEVKEKAEVSFDDIPF